MNKLKIMASIAISAFFKDSIFLTFLKISKNSLINSVILIPVKAGFILILDIIE